MFIYGVSHRQIPRTHVVALLILSIAEVALRLARPRKQSMDKCFECHLLAVFIHHIALVIA